MTSQPDLITVLKVLGSHRELLRQRIWGPLEELDRLEAELQSSETISGKKLKRIDELDKYELPEADVALYFAHPLCWLCEQLESRIGASPKDKYLERHDLEFAAYRLNTPLGLRPSHHVASKRPDLPDWRWLGPRFLDMDARGVTATFLRDLARLWPEVDGDLRLGDGGKADDAESPPGDKATKGKADGGNEKTQGNRNRRAAWLGHALMLRKEHPDWTKADIAKEVGIHPGQLSPERCLEFHALEEYMKRTPTLGYIATDPDSGQSDVVGVTPPGAKQVRGSPIEGSNLFCEYCAECDEPIRVAEGQVGGHPLCENCAG